MSTNCDSRAHEDFVLAHVTKESVRDRFKQLAFFDYIRSHPQVCSLAQQPDMLQRTRCLRYLHVSGIKFAKNAMAAKRNKHK